MYKCICLIEYSLYNLYAVYGLASLDVIMVRTSKTSTFVAILCFPDLQKGNRWFYYATGAAYCLSSTLMREMTEYLRFGPLHTYVQLYPVSFTAKLEWNGIPTHRKFLVTALTFFDSRHFEVVCKRRLSLPDDMAVAALVCELTRIYGSVPIAKDVGKMSFCMVSHAMNHLPL